MRDTGCTAHTPIVHRRRVGGGIRNESYVNIVRSGESYQEQIREMAGGDFIPRDVLDGVDLRFRDKWQQPVSRHR